MNKHDLIVALADLPGAINLAEITIIEAQANVTKAKETLSAKEADLYTENKIDGKNAEIRAAQLRQFTTQERNDIAKVENILSLARIQYNLLQNHFSAYRAIAAMMKAGE